MVSRRPHVLPLVFLALGAIVVRPSLSHAQPGAVATATLEVSQSGNMVTLTRGGQPPGELRFTRDLGASVTIRCTEPVDCTTLALAGPPTNQLRLAASSARQAAVTVVSGFSETRTLGFSVAGRPVAGVLALVPQDGTGAAVASAAPTGATTTGSATTTGAAAARAGDGETPSDAELLAIVCPFTTPRDADFVLDALGNVMQLANRTITERDTVRIVIMADQRLLGRVRLARTSPTRTFVATNTLGVNAQIPDSLRKQRGVVPECGERPFILGDFAPGAGRVTYSLYSPAGSSTVLQQLEFKVNPLYTGALALGAIRTNAGNPTYGPTFNGRDTVVSERDGAGDRVLWVLTYTPFIWGARDVSVAPRRLHERVTPLVGVVLNDVRNNAIAGITVDLGFRLYLSWGVHAARVQRIDPRSGLAVGSIANNRGPTVPTVRDWVFRSFYGLSFDVQAAVDLLRTAMGVAKP